MNAWIIVVSILLLVLIIGVYVTYKIFNGMMDVIATFMAVWLEGNFGKKDRQ